MLLRKEAVGILAVVAAALALPGRGFDVRGPFRPRVPPGFFEAAEWGQEKSLGETW